MMNIQGLLASHLILFVSFVSSIGNNQTDIDVRSMNCTKEWFYQNFVNQTRGLSADFFELYTAFCKTANPSRSAATCESGDAYITYAENQMDNEFWWIFDVVNLNHTDDCWGTYADIRSYDVVHNMRYVNFREPFETSLMMFTKSAKKVDYTFSVYSIPYGDKMQISVTSPGDCENKALDTIYQMLQGQDSNVECNNDDIDFNSRNNLASLVCRMYPNSPTDQSNLIMNKVKTRMDVTKNSCELYIQRDTPPNSSENVTYLTPTNIILAVVSLTLVVTVILLFYCYNRWKRVDEQRVTTLDNRGTRHLDPLVRVNYSQTVEDEYIFINGGSENV